MLLGAEATDRLPEEAYRSEVSAQVYKEMFASGARTAKTGWPVVVDAVFDRAADREAIELAAQSAGVSFQGFWLDLDLAHRLARVDRRVNDVSDATGEVLKAQAIKDTGEMSWRRVDARGEIDDIAGALAVLPGRGAVTDELRQQEPPRLADDPRANRRAPHWPAPADSAIACIFNGIVGASARNSRASSRVRLATESEPALLPQAAHRESSECRSCECRRRRPRRLSSPRRARAEPARRPAQRSARRRAFPARARRTPAPHAAPSDKANSRRRLVAGPHEGVHALALSDRDLRDDMRGGAEAVDADRSPPAPPSSACASR